MYDGTNPTPGGSIDPGQFFKVRLKCKQAMYVYGSVTVHPTVSRNFRVDIYDANQQLVAPNWIFTGSMGTTTFSSTPYVNLTATDLDVYIKAWGYSGPIFDFTLNIDEYVASNNVNNPKPVAEDATTGSGGSVSSEEYHLPAANDNDVLTVQKTELWAKVHWPTNLSAGPYPLVMFLHGNHSTCGHGSNPRIDLDLSDPNQAYFWQYTTMGTCPKIGDPGYSRPYDFVVVPSHTGFDYLAAQLASRGYIVVSINANRGITSGDTSHLDDPAHIFSRGRLVLKHLETLSKWNSGGQALITSSTLGTLRRNSNNWFGMKITVGAQPITVYSLGRVFVSGNTGTHTVKIVRASDSTDVPNGSVPISMTGGTPGVIKYANLATPVTLAANTSYYIASKEVKNGDYWHDSNTAVISTPAATVNGRVTSTNGSTWDTSGGVLGQAYVPVSFKYQALSVNLTGKIDFTNVGLMGHSRGGQGVRAAYNLYRTSSIDPRDSPADIVWSSTTRIPGMNMKGILEIGPTDFPLEPPSGAVKQYLNADGTAWNVLLPMCDGDVLNLQGVRVFDRMMAYTGGYSLVPADTPPTQKSNQTVWGTNHNFYNREWQQSDPLAICTGNGNIPHFSNPATDGNGSANQRTVGLASVLAFFRANVGSSASINFNQNFDPRYKPPAVITSIVPDVRIDQGFTPSPNLIRTKVLYDFLASEQPPVTANATLISTAIPDHDYSTNIIPVPTPSPVAQALRVGRISWSTPSCDTYFQANWLGPDTGENINAYQTLDFRISRMDDTSNPTGPTNFQIQFVAANGTPTGAAVSLNKYLQLTGPVGIQGFPLHSILQTVRIPLTDFTGANLSQVRGVRFIFSDTPSGVIYLANVRLSN